MAELSILLRKLNEYKFLSDGPITEQAYLASDAGRQVVRSDTKTLRKLAYKQCEQLPLWDALQSIGPILQNDYTKT